MSSFLFFSAISGFQVFVVLMAVVITLRIDIIRALAP
jgi:hypothetical protein